MTNESGARQILDFDKVDRACEIAVIDWLQWAEFPDENKAQLALTMIAKRKAAYQSLQAELDLLKLNSDCEAITNTKTIMSGTWAMKRIERLETALKQYADAPEDSPHKPQIARQALEDWQS